MEIFFLQALIGGVDELRRSHEHAIEQGVVPETVHGASVESVEQVRIGQQVSAIPQTVQDVWLLVGQIPGPWWSGEIATVGDLDGELKEIAVELHDDGGGGLVDAPGMLVLLAHEGSESHAIDGADLALPDPPVWLLMEGQPAAKMWPSVTEWFNTATRGVLR